MFCTKCGKQLNGQETFCPSCGAPITSISESSGCTAPVADPRIQESSITSQSQIENTFKKGKKGKIIAAAICIILVAAVLVLIIANIPSERENAIETVKSGYLGCYTDVTVKVFVEEVFPSSWDGSVASITWDGGTTDDGEMIVEAICTYTEDHQARIQWKMMTEDTFKFNGIVDWTNEISSLDDAVKTLNMMYFMYYSDKLDWDAAIEKLSCSCGAVLCGASKSYSGDRENLYQKAFNIEPLPSTAAGYLNLLDSQWEGDEDSNGSEYPDIAGSWQDSWSERCSMTITNEGNDYYSVNVIWASSASEYDNWVFGGYYDYSSGTLSYDCGNWYSYVDDGSGNIQECWILDDMEGILYWDGEYLHWNDYTTASGEYDFGAANMKFEQLF